MTKSEVEEIYSDWTLRDFSENKIVMYKVLNQKCNEHYVVKEENNQLVIYSEDEKQDLKFYETTDISIEYLTDLDRKNLKEGITVHGKIELEKLLEDFNS